MDNRMWCIALLFAASMDAPAMVTPAMAEDAPWVETHIGRSLSFDMASNLCHPRTYSHRR